MAAHDLSALKIRREAGDERGPRRSRRAIPWLVAAVVAVAAGWIAWRSDWLPRSAPEVRIARPRILQAGGGEEVLTATGYIVPQLQSVISARISGRLDWLGVKEGSQVAKGEVIARLSGDDLAASVAEARATLAQARATLEQARSSRWEAEREMERQGNLLDEGITTQSDFDASKRGLDVAAAGVDAAIEAVRAAEARLELSQANFDKTIIRAPFAGTVIKKSAEVGEMIAAGAFSGQPTGGAIVTLADFATLEMEADVNESNLSKISTGQAALISVDAVPGHRYRGVLRQIVPAADRQKAVVQAKVRLLEPDDRLVPDMSARVTFVTSQVSAEDAAAAPRIFIPAGAIRLVDGSPAALTVREDRVVLVPVTLGESRDGLREVIAGLEGTETLIVGGAEGLGPGDRVRIAS